MLFMVALVQQLADDFADNASGRLSSGRGDRFAQATAQILKAFTEATQMAAQQPATVCEPGAQKAHRSVPLLFGHRKEATRMTRSLPSMVAVSITEIPQ